MERFRDLLRQTEDDGALWTLTKTKPARDKVEDWHVMPTSRQVVERIKVEGPGSYLLRVYDGAGTYIGSKHTTVRSVEKLEDESDSMEARVEMSAARELVNMAKELRGLAVENAHEWREMATSLLAANQELQLKVSELEVQAAEDKPGAWHQVGEAFAEVLTDEAVAPQVFAATAGTLQALVGAVVKRLNAPAVATE